jgi:hypothetical protein
MDAYVHFVNRDAELAEWTLARLVNRIDAWGAYHPAGGQLTCRGRLTLAHLVNHFRAQNAGDVLGLHTANGDNRGGWFAIDIDCHGDHDPQRAEANLYAALWWYRRLVELGFRPLLTESNGKGGYHLRVLFSEAIDAAKLYDFARWLVADYRRAGLSYKPETFPKQRDVRKCFKRLGNWLRLPGRHHRRPFWSRVWDGSEWLDGHDAIDFMLSLSGDNPALLPDIPTPSPSPRRTYHPQVTNGSLSNRIAAYMRRLPNLAEGQGRDDVAYRFAAFLARDLALSDSIALDWLERWDAGNNPPKGRECLAEILKNARAYGQRASGCGIDPNVRQSVRIVPARKPGHYTLHASVEIW